MRRQRRAPWTPRAREAYDKTFSRVEKRATPPRCFGLNARKQVAGLQNESVGAAAVAVAIETATG